MWKSKFNENNLMFANRLFTDKKVLFVHKKGDTIDAEVLDKDVKYVHIELKNNEVINSSCTCKLDNGYCIHSASVLIDVFDNNPETKERMQEEQDQLLLDLLSSVDRELLESFIFTTLSSNPELEFDFSNFMHEYFDGLGQYEHLDRIFKELLEMNDDDFSLVDLYRLRDLSAMLFETMEVYTQELDFNDPEYLIVDMISHVLSKVNKMDVDIKKYISMGLYEAIDECLDHIYLDDENSVRKISDSVIKLINNYEDNKLFKSIFYFVKENYFDEDNFSFALDILDTIIKKFNDNPTYYSNDPVSYYTYEMFQRYLVMANKVDQKRKDKILSEYADASAIIDFQVDNFIKDKQFTDAKMLIIRQLEKGIVADNYEKLEHIYEEENDQDNLIELYKSIIMFYDPGNYSYILKLKQIFDKENFNLIVVDMCSKMINNVAKNKLLNMIGRNDLLLINVTDNYEYSEFEKYQSELKKLYPEQIYLMYEKYLNDMALNSSSREKYKYMVDLLREVKSIKDGHLIVERISNYWKNEYFKRTAMMDELSKL